ncbi:hypothetical protein [Nostoc sp.]
MAYPLDVGDRKLSVSFVAIASMTLHQGRPPDPSSTVQELSRL